MIREVSRDDFDGLMKLYMQLHNNPMPEKSAGILELWDIIVRIGQLLYSGYKKGEAEMILIIGGAYQGKTAYAKEHFPEGWRIENQYHRKVKEQMKAGKEPLEEAEKLLADGDDLIIISDEIGYGLVPVDAFEREYREKSGRVNCYFASHAEQVIRVVCGIGDRIK